MTMAMQQRVARNWRQYGFEAAGINLPREKFLEHHAVGGELFGGALVEAALRRFRTLLDLRSRHIISCCQRKKLIAEGEDATGFETDNGDAALHKGQQRRQCTLRFQACLIDEPCREESSPATKRTGAAVLRSRQMHAVTGSG